MKRKPYKLKPRKRCSVNGCDSIREGLGFCKKHYKRFKATGNPLGLKRREDGAGNINYGYKLISTKDRGRIPEHRYIIEKFIGRQLKPFPIEIVHHKNGNKLDNRIENLEVTSQKNHSVLHNRRSIIVGRKKLCVSCRKFLDISNFYFHKASNSLVANCKKCVLLKQKALKIRSSILTTKL
jgi:hypothetical protein